MSAYPDLHELIWLFESEPELLDEDLGWPISRATFTTLRGPWEVRCSIEIYDRTVEVDCLLDGDPTLRLKIRQDVDAIAVDRSHDAETLVIRPSDGAQLGEVRLRLKPQVPALRRDSSALGAVAPKCFARRWSSPDGSMTAGRSRFPRRSGRPSKYPAVFGAVGTGDRYRQWVREHRAAYALCAGLFMVVLGWRIFGDIRAGLIGGTLSAPVLYVAAPPGALGRLIEGNQKQFLDEHGHAGVRRRWALGLIAALVAVAVLVAILLIVDG